MGTTSFSGEISQGDFSGSDGFAGEITVEW